MIIYVNLRMTANEFARIVVEERGISAQYLWEEKYEQTYNRLTSKELARVQKYIDKHCDRLSEMMNTDKLWERIRRANPNMKV